MFKIGMRNQLKNVKTTTECIIFFYIFVHC